MLGAGSGLRERLRERDEEGEGLRARPSSVRAVFGPWLAVTTTWEGVVMKNLVGSGVCQHKQHTPTARTRRAHARTQA